MTAKRVPIDRPMVAHFPDASLDLFARLQEVEQQPCSCPPWNRNGEYWRHETCPSCEAWWGLHSKLSDSLPLGSFKCWEMPLVQRPDEENPFPAGSYASYRWSPNETAQERYQALAAALKARKHAGEIAPSRS